MPVKNSPQIKENLSFQEKIWPLMPFVAPFGALLIWFSPLILTRKALFWGTPSLQFIPWWSYAFQTVMDGYLPLWNPGLGMGAPLMANYQVGLFYPPTWILAGLYFLGGVPWLAWGLAPLLGLHMLFSAWGMALLLKRLKQGVLAQMVSALVWAMGSYLTARINFPSIIFAAVWLPWILWLLTPASQGQSLLKNKFVYLVACMGMLFLSGHAQTAWYVLLISAAWSAFWAVSAGDLKNQEMIGQQAVNAGWVRRLATNWAWLGGAVLLAAGVASLQLLPTAEYLLQSPRAEAVDFDLAMTYSLWPWKLATLLSPGLFGSPAQGNYWGYANYWEDAIYMGLLPLILAISYLIKRDPLQNREENDYPLQSNLSLLSSGALPSGFKLWIVIVMALSLIWGLGRFTPVFPWLFQYIPTFDLFQAPSRALIGFVFSIALLAGLGANYWHRPQGKSLYWTRLGVAGSMAISLGSGLAWLLLGEVSPTMLQSTALTGILGMTAGILSLLAPTHQNHNSLDKGDLVKKPRVWQISVLVFVTIDLMLAAWGLNPGIDLDFYRSSETYPQTSATLNAPRAYMPVSTEEYLKFKRFLTFDRFRGEEPWRQMHTYLLPNLGLFHNQAMVNNFDPFVPARYQKWMDYLDTLPVEKAQDLLAWMGVDKVLVASQQNSSGYEWLSLEAEQRVHWVACGIFADDGQQAWQIVTGSEMDWESQVVIESLQTPGLSGCEQLRPDSTASWVWMETTDPNHVEIKISTETSGWLVVADTWYPGWQVRIDSQPDTIYRANYLFRAIKVPSGEHVIEMEYRPSSFEIGLAISLISLIVTVGLGIRGNRGIAR